MKNRSTYLNALPESQYEVIDSGLSENFIDRFLQNNRGTLANAFANLIDKYAANQKGKLFTTGINAAGYSTDPVALQAFYEDNAQAIDDYFQFVNMHALADAIGGDMEEQILNSSAEWLKSRAPAFLTGAGLIALYVFIKRRRR